MKKVIILLIGLILGYLYIGVEVIGREHTVDYDLFIKKYPTTLFAFRNWVKCGECDFREYETLKDKEMEKDFRDLCYYRYGLEDISQCEDLFRH